MIATRPRLRLAWDSTTPKLTEFDGRRVTWKPWQQLKVFTCPPPPPEPCEHCGGTGTPMACGGIVHPRPGDTVQVVKGRQARHVAAWPYLRLQAIRCPHCRATDVYDMGEDGEQWICLTQPEELMLW